MEKCCGADTADLCQIVICNSRDKCCGDSDTSEPAICWALWESTEKAETWSGGSCCSAESRAPSRDSIDSNCCSKASGGCDSERKSDAIARSTTTHSDPESSGFHQDCSEHSSPKQAGTRCQWCCCCPLRPVRVPEPQPTPVAQRPSSEREMARDNEKSGDIQILRLTGQRSIRHCHAFLPCSCDTQAVLCVWRE